MEHQTQYRDVPGYPGYRVGSDGTVWSMNPKTGSWVLKKLSKVTKGDYFTTGFTRDGKTSTHLVHRMILRSFKGEPPEGMECGHRDGNGFNNNLDNLEWVTPLQNADDRRSHGTITTGSKNGRSVLNEQNVVEIARRHFEEGASISALSREFGVSTFSIRAVVKGESWLHVSRLGYTAPAQPLLKDL